MNIKIILITFISGILTLNLSYTTVFATPVSTN